MKPKSRKFCSVSQCKSYATDEISLHKFPNDTVLAKKWAITLRIGKPVSKYMLVCSLHFKDGDYHPRTPLKTRKALKYNAIPSCNIPVRQHEIIRNKKIERQRRLEIRQHRVNAIDVESNVLDCETIINNDDLASHINKFANSLEVLATVSSTQEKIAVTLNKEVQVNIPAAPILHKQNAIYKIITTNKLLIAYTGIDCEVFNCIDKLLSDDSVCGLRNSTNKLLLTLTKLKLNLSFRVLSGLFQISESNLKTYFTKTMPLLRNILQDLVFWPTIEQNRNSMPTCFAQYQKTRVVLDCTEISVQTPKCLKCRIRSYSYYKSRHTIKYLVGVNPAGMVTYISPAYGGRTSDKAIFNNEKIIDLLEPYIDHVMVDKGFFIEEECLQAGITLIRPPFLRNKSQLTKEEAETTASIARARVHVERAIQRLKIYKIFSEQIRWNLLPYVDDIAIIIAALVNLSSPILKDDKFQ